MSFTPKKLEPVLSSKVKNIIARSEGDLTADARINDVWRIKHRVMAALLDNEDLLRSIHHPILSTPEIINGDAFKDVAVFDYLSLPNLKERAYNYICFAVDTFKKGTQFRITFRCVTHEDDMRTDYGINRQDLLGLIISDEFDWSDIFGTHVEKDSSVEYVTNDHYFYREIVYLGDTPYNNFNKVIGR